MSAALKVVPGTSPPLIALLSPAPLEAAFIEYRPIEYVCGCGVKRFGPCTICEAQYQREQCIARR